MFDKTILYHFFEGKTTREKEKILLEWLKEDNNHIRFLLDERKSYDCLLLVNDKIKRKVNTNEEYNKIHNYIFASKKKKFLSPKLFKYAAACAAISLITFLTYQFAFFHLENQPVSIKDNKEEIFKSSELNKEANINLPAKIIKIKTPKAIRQSFRLPDNTLVWLNSETEIKYPEKFIGNLREVWLDGEAYFDVIHNPQQQFIVHTDGFDIKVYGTTFNVCAYNNEPNKKFTLIEGSIKLESSNKEENEELYLIPGQQAICESNNIQLKKVEAINEAGWKDGKYYFASLTFLEICRQLEHAFNVNIHIENEKLENTTFSGQFTHNETIYEILSIITHDQRIEYKIKNNDIYIYEK